MGSKSRSADGSQASHAHRSFRRRGGFWNFPGIGVLGFGGKRHAWPKETIVSDTAGQGATTGLPTTDDDGTISMIYRQVSCDFEVHRSSASMFSSSVCEPMKTLELMRVAARSMKTVLGQ